MIRLLQRMDDSQPRHGEGGASTSLPHSVTVLADADESAETALEDWSRGLDWVQWLFSSIRQRHSGLYFHAAGLPNTGLYPRATLSHQALAARWENFLQSELRGSLGSTLLQAWQAVQEQNLNRLIEQDAALDESLPPALRASSREAGERLLQGTRGARYQGLLGRYRALKEEGKTPGHFFLVWAAVAHFFQLSLTNVIAEYIRLEWELAARQVNPQAAPLPLEKITRLTSQLMHSGTPGLRLLSDADAQDTEMKEA